MTKIMGILNYTPDSFCDGGRYYSLELALQRAEQLSIEGADIIDFGAESTNPLVKKALSVAEELARISEILPEVIKKTHENNKLFSMDTYKYQVAEIALKRGADIINDQSGGQDPNMLELMKDAQKPIIIMHNLGLPSDRKVVIGPDKDATLEVYNWAKQKIEKLLAYGILLKNIIIDPGIGFGKNHLQSWQIIKNALKFKDLNIRTCFGHSKKGCMQNMGNAGYITLATSAYMFNKVNYLRVHDVKIHKALLSLLSI